MNHISEEASADVKLELLSAVMKMFFKRPPECQEMLGRLLEYSISKLPVIILTAGLVIRFIFNW